MHRWLPLLLAACSASQADRAALMQQTLVVDNATYRTRDAHLLHTKYDRMASDPYDFMRGTARWFYVDVTRPTGPRETSGDAANAGRVLLVGDPHPENLGTTFAEDTVAVEWVDLDAVTWGPWTLDVRRAALGLTALTEALPDCDCSMDAVAALARGYTLGMNDARVEYGVIIDDLVDEAKREGAEQRRLMRRTESVQGERRFLRTDGLDDDGRGMLDIPATEHDRLQRVLTDLLPRDWCISDAVQRFGSGIASLPAERLNVLAAPCGTSELVVLQVREVFDPPPVPQPTPAAPPFASNADRLRAGFDLQGQRDPMGTTAVDGLIAYKLTTAGSYSQTLDHDKIAEHWEDGDVSRTDLIDLGQDLGLALARAHSRTTTGPIRADSLDPVVLGRIAIEDHRRLLSDHAAFVELLEEYGPTLGAHQLVRP